MEFPARRLPTERVGSGRRSLLIALKINPGTGLDRDQALT